MTYSAQHRTAGLPAELRLQIMEASVLYHASSEDFHTLEDVKKFATYLFDGEHIKHTARPIYDVLHDTAEQAFLNKVIFRVCQDLTHPDILLFPLVSKPLLARIQHIHLSACVRPWQDEHKQTLEDFTSVWNFIKLHMSALKACVLTLELRTVDVETMYPEYARNLHFLPDHDNPFPAELLSASFPNNKTLSSTLSMILGEFAKIALAARCFARIVHDQYNGLAATSKYHYGPLVQADSAEVAALPDELKAEGMLAQMYKFTRTGEERQHDPKLDPEEW